MAPNLLDFVWLIFIITCYFLSSLRGGSKQIFSFVAIIFSFMIAGQHYWDVGKVLPEKVFPESFAGAAGFVVVFLLAFVVISLIGRFLDSIFKYIHFSSIDRFVSKFIGVLKGLTLGWMTVVILMVNYPADLPLLTDSMVTPYLYPGVQKVATLLPKKEQKKFFAKEGDLKRLWEKNKGNKK